MAKQLDLKGVALLGRTLDEYRRIFGLSDEELRGETILDVASGVSDFATYGTSRYVPTEYPATAFADGQFTLALVSGFLFLYEDWLSYDFHRRTVLELLRIATQEIRIFPLVNLKGERSAFLDLLLRDPGFSGCRITVERVGYEFLRGANEILRIGLVG